MKISDVIARLEAIRAKHGDVQAETDCPFCTRSFSVGVVAVAPETVRLNHRSIDGPVGTRVAEGKKR